ncbi:MAG: hypothetical protein ABFS41_01580 [Myxococcota bacterium]
MEARQPRRSTRARSLVAALIAGVAFEAGAEPQEVGFVESFTGAAEGYAIERGEERVPVFVLAPLHAGDTIHVEDAGGRIELRVGSGPARVVEAASSPFAVPASEAESTLTRNVVRWLGDWVQGSETGAEAGGISLVTRGLGLKAPLLGVENRLAAGPGSLVLAWSGGAPPYRVRLVDAGDRELLAADADEARLVVDGLALEPGALQLTIRDATGLDDIERRIEVLAAAPVAPAGLVPSGAAPDLAGVLEASWLAGVEHGAWRLEAYRRATALPESAPARALREALEAGATPPALEAP